MKLMRLHIVRLLLMALLVLPAVTSCYNYDEEESVAYSDVAANYINVTISVSASDNAITRAMPDGGEYGDGTEKGNDRENEVKNITLIFYQDAAGINTTSDEAKVVSVQRYVVRPVTDNDKLTANGEHEHKTTEPGSDYYGKEVLYTTGNQKLEGTGLVKGVTYKMLVVANAYVDINEGAKIKTDGNVIGLRDKVIGNVFTGTGKGIDATDFVMTSETEAEVTLDDPDDIETTSNETSYIYYFPCIHIERLAARIDFDTTGGSYYENPVDNTKSGYKYNMGGDIFVLTNVTPFNLYDKDEYLFKRVQDKWGTGAATTYLGDETTEPHTTLTKVANNYVVDPHTAEKNNTNSFTYLSPISPDMSTSNPYTYSMATQQTSPITICYAKENTLMPTSQLKQYATGIAFTGEYYPSGLDGPHETRTYYHYIRHQGEQSESYKAKQWNELDKDDENNDVPEVSKEGVPMNIGIVRNNIYRISIEGDGEGTLNVIVRETKWRHVDNPVIYI